VSDKHLQRGPALPSQICRLSRREREREVGGAGGPGRGVHYLDDRRLSTVGLQDVIDCRTALMSHCHALTVSMVGALHQTIDIIQQENTRNYLIQFDIDYNLVLYKDCL
jgi:hypothetical protein